jgi:integrase
MGTTSRRVVWELYPDTRRDKGVRKKLRSRHGRREIPLSPGVTERLREHRRDKYTAIAGRCSIPRPGRAQPVEHRAANPRKPAVAARGMPREVADVPVHVCVVAFDAGKNIRQVQEWLGHADPGFTRRTYHLLDEGLGDADFLDELVGPDQQQRSSVAA